MLRDFRAYQLAKELHWACKSLRISKYLQDQLLRASSSVVLNLAEGSGKRTAREQSRFYGIALGSLRECQAILDLEKIGDAELELKADQLGGMLFKLSRIERATPTEYKTENESENGTQTPNHQTQTETD